MYRKMIQNLHNNSLRVKPSKEWITSLLLSCKSMVIDPCFSLSVYTHTHYLICCTESSLKMATPSILIAAVLLLASAATTSKQMYITMMKGTTSKVSNFGSNHPAPITRFPLLRISVELPQNSILGGQDSDKGVQEQPWTRHPDKAMHIEASKYMECGLGRKCGLDPSSVCCEANGGGCDSGRYFWNNKSYWELGAKQKPKMERYRRLYITYDYCSKPSTRKPECDFNV